MNITTRMHHNHNGTAQIVAKGGGKQRTVAYNHALSHAANHGNAAGTLALVLFQGDTSRRLAAETATHTEKAAGVHVFTLGV